MTDRKVLTEMHTRPGIHHLRYGIGDAIIRTGDGRVAGDSARQIRL